MSYSSGEPLLSTETASMSTSVSEDAHTIMINKVSWGAIFAGVVVALVVQVLLTMLGVGIGLATLDPGTGDNQAASTFSIAAGIWYVLSGIIASFAGGYIAARMLETRSPAEAGLLSGPLVSLAPHEARRQSWPSVWWTT